MLRTSLFAQFDFLGGFDGKMCMAAKIKRIQTAVSLNIHFGSTIITKSQFRNFRTLLTINSILLPFNGINTHLLHQWNKPRIQLGRTRPFEFDKFGIYFTAVDF